MKIVFRIVVLSLFMISGPFISEGADITDYCQLPSSLSTPIDPNVLLAIDVSGSMGWCAYTSVTGSGSCESSSTPYVSTTTYEGYFDPTKFYTTDSNGVYVETTPTGNPCTMTCVHWDCRLSRFGNCDSQKGTHHCSWNRYACCDEYTSSGDCNVSSGNYLNYSLMRRIDTIRWALTGGRLESCNNSIASCDPEVYPNSQLSCDSSGCILETYDGTKIKTTWARITGSSGGLLFQLKNLSPKPLIGAMFFGNNGVAQTVYVGDFTGSASYDGVNPYKNTITAINYRSPSGSTPTGPVLWDVLNYFAQNSPQYGGPQPQTGTGGEWKNPLNRCFDANNDGNCQGNEFEAVPCAKNFVVLMSDGQWNRGGLPVGGYCTIDGDIEAQSPDPVVPAYYMHKIGFTNSQVSPAASSWIESVYSIGLWLDGTGELALKNVAMYGSFDRSNTWPGGTTGFPQGTCGPVTDCCTTANCAKGSPCTALPSSHSDWDQNGDGIPDTFFKAEDATQVKEGIVKIILDILRHVASGSAVSILSSSEGSGANLLQAVYYPKKSYSGTEIDWTGKMQNLWYYVDPYFSISSIREDTNSVNGTTGENILNLSDDYVVELYYDEGDNKTKAKRYSTDAAGENKTYVDTIYLEDIKNLWEAGTVLFKRTTPRTVYTTTDGSNRTDFSTTNKTTLRQYLQATDDSESERIINYINGIDQTGYRNRTITINGTTGVWKLGDIVNSSPRLQSSTPLNTYHKTPPDGYSDATYRSYIQSSGYLSRGMSYIGANDGMIHAFKHGKLEQSWTGKGSNDQARLLNPDTSTVLGSEVWAFVPKNSLPYLKYLADPDYCHLYYVDSPSILVDASIEATSTNYYNETKTANSWKSILIGGMGLGGASKITGSSCTTGSTGTCVKTPITDPSDSTKGLGYSSYFALDVTYPDDITYPKVLWEFSSPDLGYSTSGPAIVRIGDRDKNGRWFAVFASGPTGSIDPNYRQFLGKSDQNLKLFILDLKTGTLLRTIDTGITNAFGGSLFGSTIDTDRADNTSTGAYSDDVIYIGYTKKDSTTSTWTKGGVLRIITKENIDPANWSVSTVIDDIGPVTSAVAKLQDRTNKNMWLYFGSGRFFYRMGISTDDASNQRTLYGVKEPCYSSVTGPVNDMENSCTSSIVKSLLVDQSSDTPSSSLPATATGWYINLSAESGSTGAERVITDPLATSSGSVFFTTYTPSTGVCSAGGSTNIWAVKYSTGGVSYLQGIAITQVSTGAIHEIDLPSSLTERGGRRTASMTGMPPKGQGLSILVGPRPMRRVIHMKEK